MKAIIQANYTSCCFCDKPPLPDGEPFETEPRFEFKKAAIRYADKHHLTIIQGKTRDKVAIAKSNHICTHGQNYVRLDWGLCRDR